MEVLKIIILGIVEGVTEFLPISSTGHLLVVATLIDFQNSLGGTFEIFIQFGAVLAVVFFYRAELLSQVRTVRTDSGVQHLWLSIIVAFIPAGVIGYLLKDWVKANLIDTPSSSIIVAIALIVGGLIFLLLEHRFAQTPPPAAELTSITYKQALTIGVAQTIALIPGVSRSGASIIGGMLSGLDRQTATKFSFYLAIPTLGIATLYDLVTSLDEIHSGDLLALFLGTVVSAVVAWFSIGWLLRYVARSSFVPFGYYRILVGVIILLLYAASILRA